VSAASSIPPHPPLPPLANPKPSPARAKLFNQIQGGVPKLRKVQSSEKRDRGDVASAGQVYEETMHSQDVEDRERDEAMSELASHVDGEGESKRKKNLVEELGRRLGGR
jgi:hypothetical protein